MKRVWQERVIICGKILMIFFGVLLCIGLLHLHTAEEARAWQGDSESLVWGKIVRMESGVQSRKELLFMGSYSWENDYTPINQEAFVSGQEPGGGYNVYSSQTGMQSWFFYALTELFLHLGIAREDVQILLWLLNTSVFAFCYIFLCRWIGKEWGWSSAILVLSSVVVSHWLVISAPNLYWVTWTMLLPTVITAYWGIRISQGRYCCPVKWGLCIGIAFLFRFMCGFEFVSTIMCCAEIPIVFYFIKYFADPQKRKIYFRMAVIIGIIALLMFVLALALWFLQLYFCYGWQGAINQMLGTVAKRTGAFDSVVDVADVYKESLSKGRWEVVSMYFDSADVYGTLGIKEVIMLWVVTKIPCALQSKKPSRTFLSDGIVLVVSALAPVSWYFLASGHSYIHTGIDPMLWLFPFVPICLAYLGKNITELLQTPNLKWGKSLTKMKQSY